LDLSKCLNLTTLDCSYNQLTNLTFLQQFATNKLTKLALSNNNLTGDLSVLTPFINLKELNIKKNPCTGSLAFLQKMTKLESLNIENTNITTGLEYLPENLENFKFSNTPLKKELKLYGYNLLA
jgi:Leucine-rich repeat (LRR) protein